MQARLCIMQWKTEEGCNNIKKWSLSDKTATKNDLKPEQNENMRNSFAEAKNRLDLALRFAKL